MLNCYEFGRQIIESRDLDPVYVVLHEAQLDRRTLQKWLLGYWCFYHMGTASWVVDQGLYWQAMLTAAGSKDYARSSERRHFRGKSALDSVAWLKDRGVDALFKPIWRTPQTATQVMNYVKTWRGFGPWIAFKVADMLERLGVCDVKFSVDEAMYDSPREAAKTLWELEGQPRAGLGDAVGGWAVNRIVDTLVNQMVGRMGHAPPRYERLINAQEAETILCKWKSYMGGHYHVGKDIAEIKHGLERYTQCETAQRLLQAGEKSCLW